MSNYHDFVDVRDYCESYHQALCITDANGVITYMNALYCRETGLTPAAIGTHEPFTDPISKQVIQSARPSPSATPVWRRPARRDGSSRACPSSTAAGGW